MNEQKWKTAITDIGPNKIQVKGYNIGDIMDNLSYAEVVFLMLKGTLPTEAETELMNAILVSSVDHGASQPSVLGTRTVISGGNSLNAAVAGGILTIGDWHVGAIEQSARILQEWAAKAAEGGADVLGLAKEMADLLAESKKRMPGFGHRLHTADPRTSKLFDIAQRRGYLGKHILLARSL